MTRSDRPQARPRNTFPYVVAALAVLTGVAALVAFWGPDEPTVVELPMEAKVAAPPPVAPPPPAAPPAVEPKAEKAKKTRRKTSRKPPPPPPPSPPPVAQEANGEGFLVIGGASVHQGEIFVDGRSKGFAPRRIVLPAGPHDVEVVRRDGTRVGPERVTVSIRHTRSAPLRFP
jgi:hypothetical protein